MAFQTEYDRMKEKGFDPDAKTDEDKVREMQKLQPDPVEIYQRTGLLYWRERNEEKLAKQYDKKAEQFKQDEKRANVQHQRDYLRHRFGMG